MFDYRMTEAVRNAGSPAWRAAACAALVGLLLWALPAGAATYKWVDEKGNVHYSDKVPPDVVDRGRVELNRQGVPVKRMDAAPTPEQRRAREAEEESKRQLAKVQEETARRDRALLASYTSESEIDLAKNRALGTIDAALQSAAAYSERLKARRADLDTRRRQYLESKKAVPIVMEREYENLNEELGRQADFIVAKRTEMTVVAARYDADKRRYHELATAGPGAASALPESPVAGPDGGQSRKTSHR